MESCWQDDEDLCDIRSDASLLRMLAAEGGLLPRRPADMMEPSGLPAWLHWTLGALYSVTGEKTRRTYILSSSIEKNYEEMIHDLNLTTGGCQIKTNSLSCRR